MSQIDIKIEQVPGILRVGEVIINPKSYRGKRYVLYPNSLKIDWDSNFPLHLKKKQVSMVYFIVVNGIIYKIGQSSTGSGIEGCMNFYNNAGQDDPGLNRFVINYLIRKEIECGNKVEIYMIYNEPILIEVRGLFTCETAYEIISPKKMEQKCLDEYLDIVGNYPIWNYQENKKTIPSEIHKMFGNYKIDRKVK